MGGMRPAVPTWKGGMRPAVPTWKGGMRPAVPTWKGGRAVARVSIASRIAALAPMSCVEQLYDELAAAEVVLGCLLVLGSVCWLVLAARFACTGGDAPSGWGSYRHVDQLNELIREGPPLTAGAVVLLGVSMLVGVQVLGGLAIDVVVIAIPVYLSFWAIQQLKDGTWSALLTFVLVILLTFILNILMIQPMLVFLRIVGGHNHASSCTQACLKDVIDIALLAASLCVVLAAALFTQYFIGQDHTIALVPGMGVVVHLVPIVRQFKYLFPPTFLIFSLINHSLGAITSASDFFIFYFTILIFSIGFAFYIFFKSELKDGEGQPIELVGAEKPKFWEQLTYWDVQTSSETLRRCCLHPWQRCVNGFHPPMEASEHPLQSLEVLSVPNVWNLLPIGFTICNDVILFWHLPLSVEIDWSPLYKQLPFNLWHVIPKLREVLATAVLQLKKLRELLPMPHSWFIFVLSACVIVVNYPILIKAVCDPLKDVFSGLNSMRTEVKLKQQAFADAERNLNEFNQDQPKKVERVTLEHQRAEEKLKAAEEEKQTAEQVSSESLRKVEETRALLQTKGEAVEFWKSLAMRCEDLFELEQDVNVRRPAALKEVRKALDQAKIDVQRAKRATEEARNEQKRHEIALSAAEVALAQAQRCTRQLHELQVLKAKYTHDNAKARTESMEGNQKIAEQHLLKLSTDERDVEEQLATKSTELEAKGKKLAGEMGQELAGELRNARDIKLALDHAQQQLRNAEKVARKIAHARDLHETDYRQRSAELLRAQEAFDAACEELEDKARMKRIVEGGNAKHELTAKLESSKRELNGVKNRFIEALERQQIDIRDAVQGNEWKTRLAIVTTNLLYGPMLGTLLSVFRCSRTDVGSCQMSLDAVPSSPCFESIWHVLLASLSCSALVILLPGVMVARGFFQMMEPKQEIFFQPRHMCLLTVTTSVLMAVSVFADGSELMWVKPRFSLACSGVMLISLVLIPHSCTWRPLLYTKVTAYSVSVLLSLSSMFLLSLQHDPNRADEWGNERELLSSLVFAFELFIWLIILLSCAGFLALLGGAFGMGVTGFQTMQSARAIIERRNFKYDQLKRATVDFTTEVKNLSTACSAEFFGMKVAIVPLHRNASSAKAIDDALMSIPHTNLLTLLGTCTSIDGPCSYLVYSMTFELGTLQGCLATNPLDPSPLEAAHRVIVLSDAAKGLSHLHCNSLCHGNVGSHSTFLDIGGLNGIIARLGEYSTVRKRDAISAYSDIAAFGQMIAEVLTGESNPTNLRTIVRTTVGAPPALASNFPVVESANPFWVQLNCANLRKLFQVASDCLQVQGGCQMHMELVKEDLEPIRKFTEDVTRGSRECCICMEAKPRTAGLMCSCSQPGGPHLTCDSCLHDYVKAFRTDDQQSERMRRDGLIFCPMYTPGNASCAPFTDRDLAEHLTSETFDLVLWCRWEVREVRNEERFQQMIKQLRESWENMSERARRISIAQKKIAEVLTFKCPRCGQAFLDFQGCTALQCSRCPCNFCGWCLKDCGDNAHTHVAKCREKPPGVDVFYPRPRSKFDEHWRARKARMVSDALNRVEDLSEREEVRQGLRSYL